MAATFDLAKTIFVSAKEMVQLLSTQQQNFTLTVLHTLVAAVSSPSSQGGSATRVGIISGFADLSQANKAAAVQLFDAESNVTATANVGLVINFGGVKEAVQLGQLDQRHEQLPQAEHGMFVQRCQEHRCYIPEPEHLVEIRERLNFGRCSRNSSGSSTFTSCKIVEAQKEDATTSDSRRRQRNDDDDDDDDDQHEPSSTAADREQQQRQLTRLDEKRVQRLQSQIADQLAALSEARKQLENRNTALASNAATSASSATSAAAAAGGGAGASAVATLKDAVTKLTVKVQSLNSVLNELFALAAEKFKVSPTEEAVMAALRR